MFKKYSLALSLLFVLAGAGFAQAQLPAFLTAEMIWDRCIQVDVRPNIDFPDRLVDISVSNLCERNIQGDLEYKAFVDGELSEAGPIDLNLGGGPYEFSVELHSVGAPLYILFHGTFQIQYAGSIYELPVFEIMEYQALP